MNIFDKSPISQILEELSASSDWESSWWSEGVFQALRDEALELQLESIDLSLTTEPTRTE